MILKQFYLGCLAHASYIVIDERTKIAAVIDPQRDIDQYIEEANRHDATIKYVLLTHFHADFIAGHLELRDRVGAKIYLGSHAKAEYDFTPLKNDDALEFGDLRLRVLETPGHTPEGISIVAYDLKEGEEPAAVFTGDTLFVGDVGRPDLMASIGISAAELAGMLYDSLHEKLMVLPDETMVYPAHGAGSMCGKNLGKETFSTIGEQRQFNYALQPMSKEEFTAVVTAEQPDAPSYFGYDAKLNREERATLDKMLERVLEPLSLDEVLKLQAEGLQIVDSRDESHFAGSHLRGSLNISLTGKFATWSGTLLDRETGIVLVAEPGQEEQTAMRLGRIGLDHVVGFLDGGMGALASRDDLIERVERITTQTLADQAGTDAAPLVIDVRTPKEWEGAHIVGSVNIPLNKLRERLNELPTDRELALICRTGYRSSTAASILLNNGITRFRDTVGGMEAWQASGLPTHAPSTPTCQG